MSLCTNCIPDESKPEASRLNLHKEPDTAEFQTMPRLNHYENLPMAAALVASSSVVAYPLIIFCWFTGGGVGGREAGGVGGLLRLLCCRNNTQHHVSTSCY